MVIDTMERAISPFDYMEHKSLKKESFPYQKISLNGREGLILRALAVYQLLNMYWLSRVVFEQFEACSDIKRKKEQTLYKEMDHLFKNGYICRYRYKEGNTYPLEGVDNPIFYALSDGGYLYASEHELSLSYEPLKKEEYYHTDYILQTGELNQWFFSLKYALAGDVVKTDYQKYVYTKMGTGLIPAALYVQTPITTITLFLFPYQMNDHGSMFNSLLAVNSYVKSLNKPIHPIFLILTSNQKYMEEAFRVIYSYPLLSSLPIYYCMDLFYPLFLEKPYEWIYHIQYDDLKKEDAEDKNKYILMNRVSIFPKNDNGMEGAKET